MKPKRIGTLTIDYSKSGGDLGVDEHPVYEYRGYFIARGAGVARSTFLLLQYLRLF